MNLEILNKIGLTPTEIKTYEALINLKQASPAEIAQETGLTRPNTYQLLSRLESLELVKKSPKTKKITYEICSPDRLVELFNEEVKKIDKTQADFKKLINEFMSKIDLSLTKPVIKYSDENQNSVKELFLEFLDGTTGRKIYSFLNRSDDGSFTEWMDTVFIPERIKRNIPLDSIITDKGDLDQYVNTSPGQMRRSKFVNMPKFPKGTYIGISDYKVAIVHLTKNAENTGVLIDHPFVAQTMKALFQLCWND